jgi:hypothetical protein
MEVEGWHLVPRFHFNQVRLRRSVKEGGSESKKEKVVEIPAGFRSSPSFAALIERVNALLVKALENTQENINFRFCLH